ncbi:uncharacterized protein LOC106011913 [Aplysia californica]|uniref:Uncharacterized protein LOC106011913 n=1 Tax=Aplysia californica TaxID=6500 RepID=A0ABM1A0X4_APLCA|nr:uncharacterized protein LOC106011913 [Aplysia californica]
MTDGKENLLISGCGLMERSGVESKRPKVTYWGGPKDGGPVDIGQTEYITRLTALRDSLADQEQLYLAQAVDRLRMHSLANKHSSFRLRMSTNDEGSGSRPPSPRKAHSMVTTVEKFRQMRPKRHQPRVFPLQGRQLIEPQTRPSSEEPSANQTGSATYRSGRESRAKDELTYRSAPSKVNETVNNNLQRLPPPSSSIPNIGRKSLKQQENLEPNTKALLKKRNRLPKPSPQGHLVSPFLLNSDGLPGSESSPPFSHASVSKEGAPSLQRHILFNSEPGEGRWSTQNQKHPEDQNLPAVDTDTMQDFCYEYYVGKDNVSDTSGGNAGGKGSLVSEPTKKRSRQLLSRSPVSLQRKLRQGMSKLNGSNIKSFGTDGFCPPLANGVGQTPQRISYVPHRPGSTTNTDHATAASEDESDADLMSIRLPSLYREGSERFDEYDSDGNTRAHTLSFKQKSRSRARQSRHRKIDEHDIDNSALDIVRRENDVYALSDDEIPNIPQRKRIVVDMPNIIFNAASPDVDRVTPGKAEERSRPPSHNLYTETSLKKSIKQQEIRKRELKNLLEDVKELNMRTEALSSQSMNEMPP